MKKCSECFEYVDKYADDKREICEDCADELYEDEWEVVE